MKIELDLTYDLDSGKLILVNDHGDTYSTSSEELQDFLEKEIVEYLEG